MPPRSDPTSTLVNRCRPSDVREESGPGRRGRRRVEGHLGHQLVDRRKAPVLAQMLDEGDPGLFTVEITVEVEEEGLER